MVIRQGDIYWADLAEPVGSQPGYRRPVVVIQNNLFNRTRINTVVVCHLTGNLNRANSPGNVLLARGEANLPARSVANITQIATIDKAALVEKIGTLARKRLGEVLQGVGLLLNPAGGEQ